jgi:hypothetical protein
MYCNYVAGDRDCYGLIMWLRIGIVMEFNYVADDRDCYGL